MLQTEAADCRIWTSFRVIYKMFCVDAVPVQMGNRAIDIIALRKNGDLMLMRGTMHISRLIFPFFVKSTEAACAISKCGLHLMSPRRLSLTAYSE